MTVHRLSSKELKELNKDRDATIIARREQGMSWRKIADEFNLSPERCREVYANKKGTKKWNGF